MLRAKLACNPPRLMCTQKIRHARESCENFLSKRRSPVKDPKPLPPPASAPGNNLPDRMETGSRSADNIAANTYDNIATESHSANSIVNEIGLQPTGHIRSWICKVCIKPSES